MKILQFPLTRITIWFVLGILLAYYLKPNVQIVFTVLIIAICTFVITYFSLRRSGNDPIWFGLSISFLSLMIGISNQIVHTEFFQETNYIHKKDIFENPHIVTATIREKLRSTAYFDRYIVLVDQIDNTSKSGRILLNISKENEIRLPVIGSHLQIDSKLIGYSPPRNPNQFDYGRYLGDKQIYAQIYADISDIKVGSCIKKDVWYYTSKLRTKIIRNLEKSNFNKTELNVAVALILGQQQDVAPDIIRDYQYAGAIHILSVSGLHIGFILLFVTFLLKPFPNTRRGSFIKLMVILTSLFSFGVTAGFAPSVLRSVTMFSFVAIGMFFRRSTYIFYTVLVSALLILLYKPSFLFEVGFQLSYLALFFILWLQPLLVQLWSPKSKVVNYFWEILTVSFAAQIGVFPLCIYYFHQFPGLFFVTNLLVIPFLSIIMALGVVVMVLASIDIAPFFLIKVLEWGIFILNKIINSIASLEQFIIQDIPFNKYLLWSAYLLLFSTILWFKKPNFNRLFLSLIGVVVFQIAYFGTHISVNTQKELVVFNLKKGTIITERNGEKVTLFANDSLLKAGSDNKSISAYLMGNFSHLKSKKRLGNLLFFNGKKILVIDSLGVVPKNINPDILILTQSPKINLERMLDNSKVKMIVADGSNYKTYVKVWESTCVKKKIPFHATGEKGFYRLN